ncbi:MAG: ergothioneine biosynthesis protein EgtB [Acidobacteriota bacterium]
MSETSDPRVATASADATEAASPRRHDLLARYRAVRAWSDALCEPLEIEDYVVQAMPDASPTKWHLAHTTWFFETLVVQPHLRDYAAVDTRYAYLFNSYYNSLGELFTRADRGLVSRPTVAEVQAYRAHVDAAVERLIEQADVKTLDALAPTFEVGLHHEQQHQELMLTDLKYMLSRNPLAPIYREASSPVGEAPAPTRWLSFEEDLHEIGHAGGGFAYDNEGPRHRVFLESFRIASRLVTSGEYLDFVRDGGYERAELWLSDGWTAVQQEGWKAPLYWVEADGAWRQFTLTGLRGVEPAEPVCHLSFYEADAYARWVASHTSGVRLPSEAEWEIAARREEGASIAAGNFVDDGLLHPRPLAVDGNGLHQAHGDVWEWTRSPYTAYPNYQPPDGALGEYNAKFMSNQLVLRGGSCATPRSHIRSTYRNFFPAHVRWQFAGLRLARDGADG